LKAKLPISKIFINVLPGTVNVYVLQIFNKESEVPMTGYAIILNAAVQNLHAISIKRCGILLRAHAVDMCQGG